MIFEATPCKRNNTASTDWRRERGREGGREGGRGGGGGREGG